jgi:hypothetical protein
MDFATLYLELIDSTQMIGSMLAGISAEEARIKPSATAWSILETVCHLYDEERMDFRPRLEAILLRPEAEWASIDPEEWVTGRRYNEQDLSEMKERFFAERNRSLDWLRGLEHSDWTLNRASSLGTITAGDMLASWVAHDNLTIRQLVELRRARLERITRPHNLDYAGDW